MLLFSPIPAVRPHRPPYSVSLSALLSFTILHYALAFSAMVLLYVFYTQPDDCTEHKVFISLNLLFSIIVSVVSILPKVQVSPVLARPSGNSRGLDDVEGGGRN